MLRVKLKSLAAEAKIIRQEEARTPRLRYELASHRRGIVRTAARHTLLAYAFLRGRAYRSIERKCRLSPGWREVGKMVEKYGVQPLPYPSVDVFLDFDARSAEYARRKALFEAAKAAQAERFKAWPT